MFENKKLLFLIFFRAGALFMQKIIVNGLRVQSRLPMLWYCILFFDFLVLTTRFSSHFEVAYVYFPYLSLNSRWFFRFT